MVRCHPDLIRNITLTCADDFLRSAYKAASLILALTSAYRIMTSVGGMLVAPPQEQEPYELNMTLRFVGSPRSGESPNHFS
jgi:hypothetical protein